MFSTSFTSSDLTFMLNAALMTLKLTGTAVLLGTFCGLILGFIRALYPKLSTPLAWFLDIPRSVPLLIQFVLLNSMKSIAEIEVSAFTVGCIVLGIYTAAYFAEIVRSGVLSVPPNLRRASRSLGLGFFQDLRFVVLPLAARVAFPGWLNLVLGVMKDTSLVMWIGIVEIMRASQTIVTRIQEPILVICVAGAIYYVMSVVVARTGVQIEKSWKTND